MSIRRILTYPKYKFELRRSSTPVTDVNKSVKRLIRDLKDTLDAHPDGIGLAAPQINIHQRVVIVRLGIRTEDKMQHGPPIALINPEILISKDERRDFDGCLSFPNLYGETVRPHYLHVSSLNENGNTSERVFVGFDAVVVHHEIDHLDGVLFIDRLESMQDLYRVVEGEDGQLVRVPVEYEVR